LQGRDVGRRDESGGAGALVDDVARRSHVHGILHATRGAANLVHSHSGRQRPPISTGHALLLSLRGARMTRGFTPLMSAQFLSALADNAVLVIAIALLARIDAPGWMTPMLKFVFIGSYVLFAIAVGAFADTMPKARVMLITNAVKGAGCLLLLAGLHPLAAYALIGLGAAAYSPAKYGLLTELLPPARLVAANAWLEGLTIASVILGTVLGGVLVSPEFARAVGVGQAGGEAALQSAVACAFVLYIGAAVVNLLIPDSGRRYSGHPARAADLFHAFARSLTVLLADERGRLSLLTTSLLWGIGATLQFVVIDWGREALRPPRCCRESSRWALPSAPWSQRAWFR
jgi:hypothetical protein